MAYKDLREFMARLEAEQELVRVQAEVDAELEITEITDRVSKRGGPALLFENVRGYDVPVLTNAFGSLRRMALALEVSSLDEIARRVEEYLELPFAIGSGARLKALGRLAAARSFFPRIVSSGPCQEVVMEEPSLDKFPILKCWPLDAGRFITLPLVFTRDPATGRRNAGMYRLQVFDSRTTGMHWHIHKDGAENYREAERRRQRLEVAVAIGTDPATTYAATAPLPRGIDEMVFAGFLRQAPVEMVRCRTVNLEVPAHAEIVLEGYVDPEERRVEGPFGDHTGYYSLADEYPVFHLTCITHRRRPIYPATVVGRPPMEDCFMAKATERIFLPLLKVQLPEIVDLNLPLEGVFHNCAIVSIRKSYPGHAQKVMHALWGLGQMMYTKVIIVVDEDVNVQDLSEVAWKVFNHVDPARDLSIVKGPIETLDHASPLPRYGSKVGIDATRKWPSEGFARPWPEEIKMSQEIVERVTRRWKEYGIP
ncbi:MAG: menaquinone biosynthesis decarboxylase [Bacillota bacterium]|nr:menaquinone biosynthesis decarboxylase [Bacillota bacterium]